MTWANDNGPKEYNMKKLGLSCAMSIAHAGAKLRYNHPCVFTLKSSKPLPDIYHLYTQLGRCT